MKHYTKDANKSSQFAASHILKETKKRGKVYFDYILLPKSRAKVSLLPFKKGCEKVIPIILKVQTHITSPRHSTTHHKFTRTTCLYWWSFERP